MLEKMLERKEMMQTPLPVLAGFDGFVDTITHAVDKRLSPTYYDRIQTITDFSTRIASAANLSANIELVPLQTKLGGNGPIMANALLAQKAKVSYIGALGKPHIHPIFEDFVRRCDEVVSLAEPGYTDAVEFFDGKLMFGKLADLNQVNWENLVYNRSLRQLTELLRDKVLIAFTNWTMLAELNSIITGFKALLKAQKQKPYLFFDLADPQKRTLPDISDLLTIIQEMNEITPVILGLNERESTHLQSLIGFDEKFLPKRAEQLREKLKLSLVVIHPTHGAAAASEHETCWVNGPYTSQPKLTTGAGDHFNAGFCNGLIHGLNLEESLILGTHTSGFYVREKHSPSIDELFEFIRLKAKQ